jgi:hypothetical protein
MKVCLHVESAPKITGGGGNGQRILLKKLMAGWRR